MRCDVYIHMLSVYIIILPPIKLIYMLYVNYTVTY
jgi:hypothetical protein